MELVPGQELTIGEGAAISSTYPQVHRVLVPGNRILLDDGRLEIKVTGITGQEIYCQVVKGGLLGSNKGVNLPGAPLEVPSFTDKDRENLEFGLNPGVDWIAMSCVRRAEDVRPLRELLKRHGVRSPVMAKIKRPEDILNVNSILRAFDGS